MKRTLALSLLLLLAASLLLAQSNITPGGGGGGSGTVTSIATTGPLTGGTITTTGTISCGSCATTTNGGALSGVSPIAISAGGAISYSYLPDLTAAGSVWWPFGIWSPMTGQGTSNFSVGTINFPMMYLINLPVPAKVTNITFVTQNGVSSTHADIGMYSISGTTATLAWHTGSFSTAGTNTGGSVAISPVTLNPGQYYVATCADSVTTTTAPSVSSSTGAAVALLLGLNTGVTLAHSWGQNATDTCTAGVLPGTQTTTNITNSGSSTLAGVLVKISN